MTRRTCALTGHRDLPETFDKNALYDKLEELIKDGCDTFLCGMAMGFDLTALDCLVSLKQKYKIFVEACIPFGGQEAHYPPKEKERYRALVQWCDKKAILFESYRNGCFLARDRYMVDGCDCVLAYCTRDTGGTAYTVNYAREKGVEVFYLPE
ncbi:MAG: DUF1273 domain-containing protein [Clostridia bacterium]|nr:DUF1273 domain-containing protein [Clostridia bacterium]